MIMKCETFFYYFREQPIFTCKAHVFHIDPKTKRSWIAASAAAVNVSFFYDSSRGLYRIISVEGTKVRYQSNILSKSLEISPPIMHELEGGSSFINFPCNFRLLSTPPSRRT